VIRDAGHFSFVHYIVWDLATHAQNTHDTLNHVSHSVPDCPLCGCYLMTVVFDRRQGGENVIRVTSHDLLIVILGIIVSFSETHLVSTQNTHTLLCDDGVICVK